MAHAKEVCFSISEFAGTGKKRRRTVLKPVWLNERQVLALMSLLYEPVSPWSVGPRTWRELRAMRLVVRLHKGGRFYAAALSADGDLLANYIAEMAAKKAKVVDV